MTARPIMYTLPNCPACLKAKRDLKREKVDYEERDINKSPEWYQEALSYAAVVPIYVEGEAVTVGWKGDRGCYIE